MARYKPKTRPFPHQARATIRAAKARNYGIFFEPRLGKSKCALDTVGLWSMAGYVDRVLIICPRIAVDVWISQLRQHYPYPYSVETFANKGRARQTRFFIASREEVFRRTRAKDGSYRRPKQDYLTLWSPDAIIFDESHESKRPGGVTAQDFWRMVRRLRQSSAPNDTNGDRPQPWVLLLSGTPSPNGWIDLFAPFRIMDESIFGTSSQEFKDRHVVYGAGKRKWTVLRYNYEKEIIKKVRQHSYSISSEEAGLANRQFWQSLPTHLPPAAMKMYLDMAAEFIAEYAEGVITAKNAGVKRLRLLQITGGFTTDGTNIHRAKLDVLRDYARLLYDQGESVVVYSRFTPEVSAVTELLTHLGFRTHRVDGHVSPRDKAKAFEALLTPPPDPTAISFQYQAGSRAIELVGAAEVIYYGLPDGWVDFRQSMARVLGPNQQRPVRYTALSCAGTVDISVIHALRRKENIHDLMMRNPRGFLHGLI